jgi:glutamate-1-semialdehyde 2,1-aminomutase
MSSASPITARYLARTPRSAARSAEAGNWLPGGDTRSTAWFPPYPPFVAEGKGAFFTDVDGNRYVELLNNYTSLVHGHALPTVVEAVQRQLERGASFAAPHESTVSLARILCERVPSVERVRFTNSGTEAVMMALRVARAFTGRPVVAKAEGGYHGTWDDVQLSVAPPLDRAGEPEHPRAVPESPGLSPGAESSTVVIPYNDLDSARAILEPLGERLAAVIVEPVQGAGGMVPAERDYLHGLRELTRELGALLVLDEVITFRLARGGAQELYGVTPDLTTFGKIIGGGLPVGAFGGATDVMATCDPSRPGGIPHYGTFNGNPATMAGGIATLDLLTPAEYSRLNALGDRLRDGVNALGRELALSLQATGLGSLLNVHLVDGPIRGHRDVVRADRESAALLHLALLNEGLFVARRGLMSTSTPMDDALVDEVLDGIRRAVVAVDVERPARQLSLG